MFELKNTISKSSRVDEEDVKNTKSVLRDFGLYPKDKPIESFTDNELFDGIKEFQKIAGVKVDGVMRPKGETKTADMDRQYRKNATRYGASLSPDFFLSCGGAKILGKAIDRFFK